MHTERDIRSIRSLRSLAISLCTTKNLKIRIQIGGRLPLQSGVSDRITELIRRVNAIITICN
ncbi:MAG TPA: hypothetical protein DCQ98_05995 [Planctomycetaceae bacterium]|nr:hypothetical protein [Planctomycetaceae bacterium]